MNVKTKDVVMSVYAALNEHDAIQVIDRYCEYQVKQQKLDWVSEVREERQKQFDDSNFTKAIEFIDSRLEPSNKTMLDFIANGAEPSNKDVLIALKMVAEAFREREDRFYRGPPR